MKHATFEDLLSWNPCLETSCQGRTLMHRLAGRRKRWKPKHVAALLGKKGLKQDDWLWLALHYLAYTGSKQVLVDWAGYCVRSARSALAVAPQGNRKETARYRVDCAGNSFRDLVGQSDPYDAADSADTVVTQAALASKLPYNKAELRLLKRLAKLMCEAK